MSSVKAHAITRATIKARSIAANWPSVSSVSTSTTNHLRAASAAVRSRFGAIHSRRYPAVSPFSSDATARPPPAGTADTAAGPFRSCEDGLQALPPQGQDDGLRSPPRASRSGRVAATRSARAGAARRVPDQGSAGRLSQAQSAAFGRPGRHFPRPTSHSCRIFGASCHFEKTTAGGMPRRRKKTGPALASETLGHLENTNVIECRCDASGRWKFVVDRDLFVMIPLALRRATSARAGMAQGGGQEQTPGYERAGGAMAQGGGPEQTPVCAPARSAPEGSGTRGSASQASMSLHTLSPCRSRVSMW